MQIRATEHEVGAGLADLRAADHQPKVVRLRVPSSNDKAVIHGGMQADLVTFKTVADALFQCGIYFRMFHGWRDGIRLFHGVLQGKTRMTDYR